MVLDKKEQNIVWILGIGAVAFALYFGGNWWMDQRAALEKKRTTVAKQDSEDARTLQKGKSALADFEARKIQTLDPNKLDMAATDRLVKTTFDAAGLTFTNWGGAGARAVAGNKEFMEARYTGTALTTTARLARFLQQIESASIPARIDTITITTPKPGQDNLRVEFTVSALLYLPPKVTTGRGGTAVTPSVTRPVETTAPGVAPTTPPGSPGSLSDVEMKRLEDQLVKRREEEAARLATQPAAPPAVKKTPEEIEAEMILKRQQEDLATSKPATAPGGTQ